MNLRRTVCLLVITPLIMMTFTANPVTASAETHNAYLGVAMFGRCLVHYDVPPIGPGGTPSEGDYTEWKSPFGTFVFGGKAQAEYGISEWYTGEIPSVEGEWYTTVPGTMKARGWLLVYWKHEGTNYAIRGRIYSKSTTHGLVEPDQDIFWIKGAEGGMTFTGVFRAGLERKPLQCGITFVVAPSASGPGYSMLVRLQIGPGWPCDVVTFWWYEKGLEITLPWITISLPPALLFAHQVVTV